jgi:hypothetical protein
MLKLSRQLLCWDRSLKVRSVLSRHLPVRTEDCSRNFSQVGWSPDGESNVRASEYVTVLITRTPVFGVLHDTSFVNQRSFISMDVSSSLLSICIAKLFSPCSLYIPVTRTGASRQAATDHHNCSCFPVI